MAMNKKIRIGDLLVSSEVITEEQLMASLARQKESGQKLGRVLIEAGLIDEDQFLSFLSQQLEIPFVDLKRFNFDVTLIQRLPETYARRYRALLLSDEGATLLVGMADPMDIFAFDELERILEQPIRQAVVRESELLSTLDLVYRRTEEIATFRRGAG
jgi:MSHA biogenesis protein MshE